LQSFKQSQSATEQNFYEEIVWIREVFQNGVDLCPGEYHIIKGYKRLHTKGISTVTIDNGQNDNDVFVKLVSVGGTKSYPVRTFYIPPHGAFTVKNVAPGEYDIRYKNLVSGGLAKSEQFNLEEIPTETGRQYSNLTMTLYKVRDGNMKTYDLSDDEF
jgi:hypothetical protein